MKATTIHIKTDSDTRDAAKEVAEAFGFTLTSMVNALLKQVARTRRLTVSLDETPNAYMIAGLAESEEDVKTGRIISFDNPKDALAYLASDLDDEHSTTP